MCRLGPTPLVSPDEPNEGDCSSDASACVDPTDEDADTTGDEGEDTGGPVLWPIPTVRPLARRLRASSPPTARTTAADTKLHGLDNAIAHVLANCVKNPQAPGLLNALEHLAANQAKHEAHEAEKAERKAAHDAAKAEKHAGGPGHGKGHGSNGEHGNPLDGVHGNPHGDAGHGHGGSHGNGH